MTKNRTSDNIDKLYNEANKELHELQTLKTTKKNSIAELKKGTTDYLNKLLPGITGIDFSSCVVSFVDSENEYTYRTVDGKIKLTKMPHYKDMCGGGFFGHHPMMMMQMRAEEMQSKEVFWEGDESPEDEKKVNYLDLLRDDILSKGEISTYLKNYRSKLDTLLEKEYKNYTVVVDELDKHISKIEFNVGDTLVGSKLFSLNPHDIKIEDDDSLISVKFKKTTKKYNYFQFKTKNGIEITKQFNTFNQILEKLIKWNQSLRELAKEMTEASWKN